jgi:aminoglycoside phosphotransferase (APT) family kinase protein
LDNLIVRYGRLAGVIDFLGAAFSDPVYEFLLSFFVSPELKGRGMEKRYCRQIGVEPAILHWYHGLEFFETWHYV